MHKGLEMCGALSFTSSLLKSDENLQSCLQNSAAADSIWTCK